MGKNEKKWSWSKRIIVALWAVTATGILGLTLLFLLAKWDIYF